MQFFRQRERIMVESMKNDSIYSLDMKCFILPRKGFKIRMYPFSNKPDVYEVLFTVNLILNSGSNFDA